MRITEIQQQEDIVLYHGTTGSPTPHDNMFFSKDAAFAADYGHVYRYEIKLGQSFDSLDEDMVRPFLPLHDTYDDADITTMQEYMERSSDTWEMIEASISSIASRYDSAIIYEGGVQNFYVFRKENVRLIDDAIYEAAAYHGTSTAFTSFAFQKSNSHPSKIGIWVTNDAEVAKGFGKLTKRMVDDQPRVIAVDIRIHNPAVFDDYAGFLTMFREFGDAAKMRRALMRKGYDGIEITNSTTDGMPVRTDYAVFDKHQIEIIGSEPITEAFDSVQPYQWSHWEDETAQEVMAEFQIGDGHFKVMFKEKAYERGIWELSFYRNGTLDLTGTGSAATVLSTVMQITRDFISTQNPRYIGYAAKNEEGSRNKLYPKLMAKLMKEFPEYTAHPPKKMRTYTSYDLERPAKAYVPPEPVAAPEPEHKPLSPDEWDELEAFMNEFENQHRRR